MKLYITLDNEEYLRLFHKLKYIPFPFLFDDILQDHILLKHIMLL